MKVKKITNWLFGGFFRAIGRYFAILVILFVFSFIISKTNIKISDLLGFSYVNAEVLYDLENNPDMFEFGVLGGSYPTASNVCYGSTPTIEEQEHIIDNSDYSSSNGFLLLSHQSGGFKTSDIYTTDTTGFKKLFYQLEFKIDREYINNTNKLFKDYVVYYNVLVATGNVDLFTNASWHSTVNIPNSTYTGKLFYNGGYDTPNWIYFNSVDLDLTVTSNGGNLFWLSYKIQFPNTFHQYGTNGVLLDYFVDTTDYVYCNGSDVWSGEESWFYILDSRIENDLFNPNTLTFNDIDVDENNIFIPEGYGGTPEPTPPATTDDINNSINNPDTTEATGEFDDFFSDFTTNTHGLTSIVTAPLSFIQSLSSKTCSPLQLPLPYVNSSLTLPCMREIYISNFGSFMNLYDVITLGIISYWVLVRIFSLVKDFKNPEHDEIEVVDL